MKQGDSLIEFRPITLSDRPTIEHILKAAALRGELSELCDYTFANLYLWRSMYQAQWALFEGFLLFRLCCFGRCHWAYLKPIGVNAEQEASSYEAILCSLVKDAELRGEPFRMQYLDRPFVEKMQGYCVSFNEKYFAYADRSYANYIYRTEKLATLAGRKLAPRRNHIRHFLEEYPDYRVTPLGKADADVAMNLFLRWESDKKVSTPVDVSLWEAEQQVIKEAFEHFDELGLEGILLSVRDENAEGECYRPVAYTFGSELTQDCFCTHVEKADPSCKNAFPMINRLFAERLVDRYTYVNREEDLGKPGLRRAKEAYYPEKLSEAWFILERSSEDFKVWNLWQEAFGDDNEFLTEYMLLYSRGPCDCAGDSKVLIYENENPSKSLLAMAHIHYFEMELSSIGKIRAGYIYAVATAVSARGKGYGTKVVERALARLQACPESPCAIAFIIQANLSFNAWENRLGFIKSPLKVTELDFGDERLCTIYGSDQDSDRFLVKILEGPDSEKIERAILSMEPPLKMKFIC